ncbi:general secretion pathway protein GspL [Cupriavidus sp. USMAHM13]|uniref:type II secretion system protein GspL n=1 Tax=Cupriavidus sp. USMAHM13 TaxID=1389192 RepID=UPI0008A6B5B4|nr:type II secretion system protein GspL [Cupriavidus sp. USMAHM13]AOY97982.1 general secretion pathway protein GspL [Cupriavidus sp. USMAHM13]
MSTSLYVRIPPRPHDQPQPWRFGALPFALVRDPAAAAGRRAAVAPASTVLREGNARVEELPAADRLVLILSAGDVLLSEADVPPLAPARLKLALPNLVEDILAGDALLSHIAVGPALDAAAAGTPRAARRRLLMVVDLAWLRAVLDAFAEHSHRRRCVLPAQLCLPLAEPAAPDSAADGEAATEPPPAAAAAPATLAIEDATPTLEQADGLLADDAIAAPRQAQRLWQLTVRTGPHAGYGLLLGSESLAGWLALAPAGNWIADREAGRHAGLPVAPAALGWPQWLAGAQDCLRDAALDLAQFEFAQGRAERWNLRAWRLPLALAAGLLLVQLAGMNILWLKLHQEQQRLAAAQLQALRSAFPQLPVVVDPPLQMRRQVEQLRLASGRSVPDDFLPLADRFAQAARQLPPDGLLGLEYRSRTLYVTLKAGTDTATLRSAARQAGLAMDEDNSPREGSQAPAGSSRWTVKPAL